MKAQSLEQTNFESARWLHFLSRWALATVLFGVLGLAIYFGGIGSHSSIVAREYGILTLLELARRLHACGMVR